MLWSEMAEDVVNFLDYEGYDQAQIVGHSLGGKIAMAMALLHPDRVQNLVVVDIAPVNYPPVSEPLLILQVGLSSMLRAYLFCSLTLTLITALIIHIITIACL